MNMTKNRMIRMVMTVVLLMMTTVAMADGATFKITEGVVDAATKAKMESNVTLMMSLFKSAADEEQKKPKLSKDNFTPEAIKDVELMWKTSAMSCPPVSIMSRCLKTASGYQVRGIPVDMIEADQEESRQWDRRRVTSIMRADRSLWISWRTSEQRITARISTC